MFRRIAHRLPQDPVFPATLEKLGLRVTEDLHFVDALTGKHIDNFVSDNERYNDVRKEAMHAATRRQMIAEASKQGMQEIYICDEIDANGGARLAETKPEGKHITILTTKLEQLRKRNDVIILIGERNQDLGVFAYRSFMRHGGMYGASAVGLIKLLNAMNDQSPTLRSETEEEVVSLNVLSRDMG
nr:hypothetical protein CFP56_20559 [Quercus suber]